MKYIVITGGVISGIGKGITASSIGLLLKLRGFNVTAIKIDPYLNIDAGTMSPFEHGECYVLQDGSEVDLDLGNYERFLDINLTKDHSITTGKIFKTVIDNERSGIYLGQTIQIIPHITNEIQHRISSVSHSPINNTIPDICILELGGTVGDIETRPFIEALRQMSFKNRSEFCFVHVSMLISSGNELKTKPTQHSVSELRSLGIYPDLLVIRSPSDLTPELKHKLEIFCNIPHDNIISNINVPNIYFVPKLFETQHIFSKISSIINLNPSLSPDFSYYNTILHYFDNINTYKKYKLVIAGKYVDHQDTYLSLLRSIEHSLFFIGNIYTDIIWLDTDTITSSNVSTLLQCDAIIIPGGFGSRGIPGKLLVAQYARLHNIPTLGICLGMQIMVTEFSRNVCLLDAKSSEWSIDGSINIIDLLPDQSDLKGGSMRLGNYTSTLSDSKVKSLYNSSSITERHRHRYEVNTSYVDLLELHGLKFVARSNNLLEICELVNHIFYIGCQFHPEYNSKFHRPHPLFLGLFHSMISKSS